MILLWPSSHKRSCVSTTTSWMLNMKLIATATKSFSWQIQNTNKDCLCYCWQHLVIAVMWQLSCLSHLVSSPEICHQWQPENVQTCNTAWRCKALTPSCSTDHQQGSFQSPEKQKPLTMGQGIERQTVQNQLSACTQNVESGLASCIVHHPTCHGNDARVFRSLG